MQLNYNRTEPTTSNGVKGVIYFLDNKRHRLGGPAIEYQDGSYHYYVDNKRHKLDGHASYYAASNVKEWWINDTKINVNSQEEFEAWLSTIPTQNKIIKSKDSMLDFLNSVTESKEIISYAETMFKSDVDFVVMKTGSSIIISLTNK